MSIVIPAGYPLIPVADLIPYANNARTHSEEQVTKIASSIREFGWTNPVITDGKGGLIAGHGRILAAKLLKIPAVPYVELAHLTEAQVKAYILADNRLALDAGWDEDLLRLELAHLTELEFDLSLTGFELDEISTLLNFEPESDDEVTDDSEDVPAAEAVVISQTGDLWTLGHHRILCGDSGNQADVATVLGEDKVDQVVTDPPYGVDYSAKNEYLNKWGKGNRVQKPIANDAIDDYREFFSRFLKPIPFAPKNTVYIFMSGQQIHNLRLAAEDAGLYWSDWLVWFKNNHVLGRKDYNLKHELVYYGWKGRHKFYGDFSTSVLEYPRPSKSDLHPTMKPVPLIARLMTDGSKKDAIVYEPFSGSGTAIVAAEQTGRKCRAIELDPAYVDVAIRRWQQLTGGEAVRQDGLTFAQAEAEVHGAQ